MSSRADPDAADDADDADDADEWKFGIDDVGEDAEETADPTDATAPTDTGSAARVRDPIEPESPSIENVAFVLVGVLLAIAIVLVTVGAVP